MISNQERLFKFKESDTVTDTIGGELSILDDDYEYYKQQLENLTNPLSDDYNKYDNE